MILCVQRSPSRVCCPEEYAAGLARLQVRNCIARRHDVHVRPLATLRPLADNKFAITLITSPGIEKATIGGPADNGQISILPAGCIRDVQAAQVVPGQNGDFG